MRGSQNARPPHHPTRILFDRESNGVEVLQVASIKQIQLRIHLLLVPLQKPWGNASIFFALLLHCTHDILLDRQGVGFDAAELFHGRYLLGHELKAKTSAL